MTVCTQEKYFELNARYVCLKNAQVCEFPKTDSKQKHVIPETSGVNHIV